MGENVQTELSVVRLTKEDEFKDQGKIGMAWRGKKPERQIGKRKRVAAPAGWQAGISQIVV